MKIVQILMNKMEKKEDEIINSFHYFEEDEEV
jgi:hypothetical protein